MPADTAIAQEARDRSGDVACDHLAASGHRAGVVAAADDLEAAASGCTSLLSRSATQVDDPDAALTIKQAVNDDSLWNFTIRTSAVGSIQTGEEILGPIGDGGSATADVRSGLVTVSESGAGDVNEWAYDTTVACVDDGTSETAPFVLVPDTGNRTGGITLAEGQRVTCTFINRLRADSTLTVRKTVDDRSAWVIRFQTGRLGEREVVDEVLSDPLGDGDSARFVTVGPVFVRVSESGATGLDEDRYRMTVAGVCPTAGGCPDAGSV